MESLKSVCWRIDFPVTSIPFVIKTIQRSQFRWSYLRNKKTFLNLFLYFWNVDKILNIFRQTKTFIADVFRKLQTTKKVLK